MENLKKEDYNNIPVSYCQHCLSLNIRNETCLDDLYYCAECGSTLILDAHIEEWENLYKNKYGFKLIER